ncbi:MAG TPA: hypothetical protein VGR35_16420 [Tepidisphaeraceae bacterium]|nr:hypothetical protein [Tepidisphaeraceae bacterium]
MRGRKKYRTTFTDAELVDALAKVGGDPERLEGNMGAFFRQQARPERDRQLARAKQVAQTLSAAATLKGIECPADSPRR